MNHLYLEELRNKIIPTVKETCKKRGYTDGIVFIEYVIKKELEIAKRDFINLLQNNFSEEIKTTNNSYYLKPIRIKKPFRYKVRDFFNNISKVFGF